MALFEIKKSMKLPDKKSFDNTELDKVISILEELRELSGNAQLDKLKEHKDNQLLKDILIHTYDPHLKYKIQESKFAKFEYLLNKKAKLDFNYWDRFCFILAILANKRAANESDIRYMFEEVLMYLDSKYVELFKGVLFKDLKLNLGVTSINKVFGLETMKDTCVTLAQDFKGNLPKVAQISRKVDGKRGYIKQGQAFGRSNKAFKQAPIQHIIDQMAEFDPDYVYDGEFAYFNENFEEDFQKTCSLLASDERLPGCERLFFMIFDRILISDFEERIEPKTTFEENADQLAFKYGVNGGGNGIQCTLEPNIILVKQYSNEDFDKLTAMYKANNWEGLIIRNGEIPYQYKRSGHFQRLKAMQDDEFKVVGFKNGNKNTKFENTLGAVTIELPTGDKVDVGSGFSDVDRDIIWSKRTAIIEQGLWAKVQFFTRTSNKQGGNGLRFPVFIAFRDINTAEEIPVANI